MISEQQKFGARVCTFENKRCSPEKRQEIACKAVRVFLWHILPEVTRKGVEAAELLAQNAPEKKQAKKTLREAQKAHAAFCHPSESRATVPEFVINASSCAMVATFTPLDWSNFWNVFYKIPDRNGFWGGSRVSLRINGLRQAMPQTE